MAKFICLFVALIVVTAIHGSQVDSNQRHQRVSNQDIAMEDLNKIDHGDKQAKPEPELYDKTVESKKISHKKKTKMEKQSHGEDGHKTLGHRGEQKWHSKEHENKKKAGRFDSNEDLHLQDLDHGRKDGQLGSEEKDPKRKVDKDKTDHGKMFKKEKKEKKHKKDKEMKKKDKEMKKKDKEMKKKDKEMKKKDKDNKKKPKNRKSNHKDKSFEAIP